MQKKDKQYWYRAGIGKDGEAVKPRTVPKNQLSVTEAKVLKLFKENDTPKAMLDALVEYVAAWPGDEFTEAKMSRDLLSLKKNGFLDSNTAVPVMTSKHTQSYKYRKKMIFTLSDKAKTGQLTIDAKRWILVNGVYVANKLTRERAETRKKNKQAFFTLGQPKNKRVLKEA